MLTPPAGNEDKISKPVERFLREILSDTPTSIYEECAAWCLSPSQAGAPEESGQRISALMTGVRDRLLALQRRETQSRALHDTAVGMTRLGDVNHVLKAIVDRARLLLRCEIAYIAVPAEDEIDTFVVKVWSGPLSPKLRGTRVRLGEGLGGRVAELRRAIQVPDYVKNDTFTHDVDLDEAIKAQGLVSLLGVPLEIDSRLLGVLIAGGRKVHEFTEDEVNQLSWLGSFAAIALDNAQLFQAQEETLAELSAVNAKVREQNLSIQRAEEFHGQLIEIVLRGDDTTKIVSVLAATLNADVTFVDVDQETVLATRGSVALLPPFAPPIQRAISRSVVEGRSISVSLEDGLWCTATAAQAGTRPLGHLVVGHENQPTDVDRRTLERASQALALTILSDTAHAEADRRASGELVRRLVTPNYGSTGLRMRARRAGLANGPVTIIVGNLGDPCDRESSSALSVMEAFTRAKSGVCSELDGDLVMLTPTSALSLHLKELSDDLARVGSGMTLVRSRTAANMFDLPHKFLEARRCLRLMPAIGRSGTWAQVDEFGMYSMLFTDDAVSGLRTFLDANIGVLLAYDNMHDGQLTMTAMAYLDAGGSQSGAAPTLGIHANTVAQRVARIDRLLGPDWRQHPRLLEVHTALRLHHLRAQAGGIPPG